MAEATRKNAAVLKAEANGVEVEYAPERIMNENGAYFDASAGRAGGGRVNLASGGLQYSHVDGAGISHVYNTWQADGTASVIEDAADEKGGKARASFEHFCGKGWKLSLHQYLVKRKGTDGKDVYTYVDGSGNYHELSERYYYKESGKKNYLDKGDVAVGLDGRLTYADGDGKKREVERELKTTSGLSLQTDLRGFAGWEKLELRSEDRARLEEDAESLARTISDCRFALAEYKKSQETLNAEGRIAELTGDIIGDKGQADIYLRKNSEGKYVSFPGAVYDQKKSEYEAAASAVADVQINAAPTERGEEIKITDKESEKEYTIPSFQGPTKGELQAQRDKADALSSAQDNLSNAIDALQQSIREKSNEIERINWAEARKNQARQEKRYAELYARAEADLERALALLDLRRFELALLKAQEPALFLSDGSGVLAFNEAGVLVALADAYENVTYINYDEGRITSVTDTDGKETKLEYNADGFLSRITDGDEKSIRFDYYNGTLSRVAYPDGTQSEFSYVGEFNLLRTASNATGYGIKFTYDREKVVKIEELTSTDKISSDGLRPLESAEEVETLADIAYNTPLCTTLTDARGVSATYIFDVLGRPVTVFEGVYADPGENTKSLCIEYKDGQKAFSISDDLSRENLLAKADAVLGGTFTTDPQGAARKEYAVDLADLSGATDFVFSAWARADSAVLEGERRFELRAELTYDDGLHAETASASFDWLNVDWQYLALPVYVDEDNDGVGDRLNGALRFPFTLGNEKRKLIGMKLIFDYNGNAGGAEFDCITLRKGKWTYREYDADGKVTTSEDDKGNKTSYEYDEDGNVTRATLTDSRYNEFASTYEYDKQGKLVRSTDYNGLVEETVYDEKGRATKSITYNVSDPTSKLYAESVRDEKGRVTADVDASGEFNAAEYAYDHTGAVNVVTDAEGGKVAFGYHNDELTSVSGDCDGEENSNTITRTLGFVTKVSSGGTKYTYDYDGFGRMTDISISGIKYSETEYVDAQTTRITLGGRDNFTTVTDKYGKVTEVKYNEETIVENVYDENGTLTASIDNSGEKEYTLNYEYDTDGRLVSERQSTAEDGVILEKKIEYNRQGSVKRSEYLLNETELLYDYECDNTPEQRLTEITLPGGTKQKIRNDGLGRTTEVATGKLTKNVYYAKFGDHATNLVNSVWHGVDGTLDENTRYAYDKNGNIVSVKENGKETAKYAYDSLNRLVKEENTEFGKTEIEYDGNGNILSKNVNGNSIKYAYSQKDWRDRLLSYNGQQIGEYDAVGNPWIYRGVGLEWSRGRNLDKYGEIAFTYNAQGIRTSKKVGNVETTYILDGATIVCEERRTNGTLTDTIYYHYGADGIAGFKHNGVSYLYRKNVQGDITHIYEKGIHGMLTLKARYVYDAWGNTRVTQDSNQFIANLNPFTYRGYYFDLETGLYYLQSRYYDPQVGRFINADEISELDPKTINGLNLYSYCANNAVMAIDPNGNAWSWKKFLIAVAIVAVVVAVVAVTVATAGGATLAFAGAGGTLIGVGTGAAAVATSVATAAIVTATVATVAAATLAVIEENKRLSGDYTVYQLVDKTTNEIVYVGRTKNPIAREAAHRRNYSNTDFVPIKTGLTKYEARGLEQIAMLHYNTKAYLNKINGISPHNKKLAGFMYLGAQFVYYLGNVVSNEVLNWRGI
jgi:RHS repeat-associated protein